MIEEYRPRIGVLNQWADSADFPDELYLLLRKLNLAVAELDESPDSFKAEGAVKDALEAYNLRAVGIMTDTTDLVEYRFRDFVEDLFRTGACTSAEDFIAIFNQNMLGQNVLRGTAVRYSFHKVQSDYIDSDGKYANGLSFLLTFSIINYSLGDYYEEWYPCDRRVKFTAKDLQPLCNQIELESETQND